MIQEVINEELLQQQRVKITLGHIFKKYAYTNDIQKMIYLILKYANVEFDYDRNIESPIERLKRYQSWWKKFIQCLNYAIQYLPNLLRRFCLFKICFIKNEIGNYQQFDLSKYFANFNTN